MRMQRIRRRRSALLAVVAVPGLLAAGCGGDEPEAASVQQEATDMDVNGEEDGDDHGGDFAFGAPADPADADRTIEVEASDDLTFEPDSIEVAAGEVVTFEVVNTGSNAHDFTLGDEAAQAEHEAEMQEMAGEAMHDEPNAIRVDAGETKELTWRFTEAGEVLFGCHQPGHYDGGMVGTVEVTA